MLLFVKKLKVMEIDSTVQPGPDTSIMKSSGLSRQKRFKSGGYQQGVKLESEKKHTTSETTRKTDLNMRFTCTCPEGTKKNRCQHAVFIECKLNLGNIPQMPWHQLQPKKKRGRPRKAITQSQASRSRVQLQSQFAASSPRRLQTDAPSTSTGFGFSVFSIEPS
ncbi:unnamed protein product [Bursaphelenchus xylophilus]|uniref:(pine wood nematode) hypothetical protein n=1 Tax=Bursaphelenchus xylophilus TaxID=6326 RepID=A0A7I8XLI3_BURXY|nr:unnamed protein product [Bursaphelenchus xylophilus]CAG9089791.1 unnamed protein product [Bursaphelenchus xylophilus]